MAKNVKETMYNTALSASMILRTYSKLYVSKNFCLKSAFNQKAFIKAPMAKLFASNKIWLAYLTSSKNLSSFSAR